MPPCSPVPVIPRSASRLFGADYLRTARSNPIRGTAFLCVLRARRCHTVQASPRDPV